MVVLKDKVSVLGPGVGLEPRVLVNITELNDTVKWRPDITLIVWIRFGSGCAKRLFRFGYKIATNVSRQLHKRRHLSGFPEKNMQSKNVTKSQNVSTPLQSRDGKESSLFGFGSMLLVLVKFVERGLQLCSVY